MHEQDTLLCSYLQDNGSGSESEVHDAAILNGRQASEIWLSIIRASVPV